MNYKSLKSMNKHLWRQALDAVHGAALIIDARSASREIVYANPAAGRLLGAQAGVGRVGQGGDVVDQVASVRQHGRDDGGSPGVDREQRR
ncbi:MAG: PAS domain-containing protein, partial [Gammaproteobacteria bacterium]|nr:PAS domain-containing protein [Gammaproteobacteria bacterium]